VLLKRDFPALFNELWVLRLFRVLNALFGWLAGWLPACCTGCCATMYQQVLIRWLAGCCTSQPKGAKIYIY